ncbi:hypothetical protein [Pedobacter sp. CFBP9032]|uniref:hypothetical protein n=1 Tax=Pedobacter sp. CFBP9032 TaxID=3096539 RepID=UPI002A6B6EEF|nr:hypothetical protein [Pedobacter sp. CFBP9032]MDY0906576.1 hypothetical protein [Pedobacter sp. CFBP9032]
MVNKQIYLLSENGTYGKLELEDFSFAETSFSIADIADITTRKDTTTKNIQIKGTKANNRLLGSLFNLNRTHNGNYGESLMFNYNMNKECDCLYYENDSLISKGFFKIIDVTVDSSGNVVYSAVITGYTVNFFGKIKDLLLSDLDFSEYNHTYSMNNILDSWTNTSGYIYGVADYGQSVFGDEETVNKIDYKDFRPSFFVKEYFNKIFQQPVLSSYTYAIEGNEDFKDKFNHLVVPNNADVLTNSLSGGVVLYGTKDNVQNYFGGDNQKGNQGNGVNTYKTQIAWANFTDDKGFFMPNSQPYFDYTNNIFTCTKSVNTTLEVNINVIYNTNFLINAPQQYLNYDSKILILIRASGSQAWNVASQSQVTRINLNGTNNTTTKLLKFKSALNVTAGSQVSVCVYNDNYSYPNGTPPVSPAMGVFVYSTQNSFIQFGDSISTTKYELELNDMIDFKKQTSFNTYKQGDFVKSILNMFNLYIYSNIENPKHIVFTPYNDFYDDFTPLKLVGAANNWSDKIDFAKLKINSFQQIFKSYKFQFKEDTDYLNAAYKEKYGLAYGNYTYNNTTSITTDSAIQVIFSPTPVATFGNRNYPMFFAYDSTSNKVAKQTNIRLMFHTGTKSCDDYEIGNWFKNAETGEYQFQTYNMVSGFYPELHTIYNGLDLNFGEPNEIYYQDIQSSNTVFQDFYQNQIEEYNDGNTATIEVSGYLNEIDISNLNFKKPVFIDAPNGSGYYKLLSVDYGNNAQPTDIILQKIYMKDN